MMDMKEDTQLLPGEAELHAYVDGRLDAAGRAAVEGRLAVDAEAAERVRAWRQQRDLLRALHADVRDEPVPEHLLPAADSKKLTSHDGRFVSRALFPFDERRRVEFYELTLKPGGVEQAHAHNPGTVENLVVAQGQLEMDASGYLKVKAGTASTAIEGVYAAGDVTDDVYRQAVTAAGMGCMAALEAEKFLANLDVGESPAKAAAE